VTATLAIQFKSNRLRHPSDFASANGRRLGHWFTPSKRLPVV
jgi:hypothetical protein